MSVEELKVNARVGSNIDVHFNLQCMHGDNLLRGYRFMYFVQKKRITLILCIYVSSTPLLLPENAFKET